MSLAPPLLLEFLGFPGFQINLYGFRYCFVYLVFVLCSYFYFCRADHCLCAAHFRFVRLSRRGFAFTCFALPRRHCAPTSTTLGHESERLDDQLLGRFLSFVHVAGFHLGRLSFSIRPDWNGRWRHSWNARIDADSVGKPTRRTLLYSEPLARIRHRIRDRRTCSLRLVARYAREQRCCWRSALVDHDLRDAAFPGNCCRIDRLLFSLLHWSALATLVVRSTAVETALESAVLSGNFQRLKSGGRETGEDQKFASFHCGNSLRSLLSRCCPRSFAFYLGNSFVDPAFLLSSLL